MNVVGFAVGVALWAPAIPAKLAVASITMATRIPVPPTQEPLLRPLRLIPPPPVECTRYLVRMAEAPGFLSGPVGALPLSRQERGRPPRPACIARLALEAPGRGRSPGSGPGGDRWSLRDVPRAPIARAGACPEAPAETRRTRRRRPRTATCPSLPWPWSRRRGPPYG